MCTVVVCISLSSLLSAALLSPPSNNPPRLPQTPSTPFLPTNITTTNTTLPPSNVLRIQCDGTRYGRNLRPNSCRNVFDHIAKSDLQTTFSERHTGRPNDLPLPWRVLSSDGLCFVQPVLLRGAVTGHASSTQIAQAAYTLFERCVVGRGVGAVAADIGGDNHLNVVISDYAPQVRCDRTAAPGPPWASCLVIAADMMATTNRQVFGDKSRDPRVEVNLPYYFKAIDARCQASVEISGKSTSATWYEIWEAMSALFAVCVRAQEKGGKAFGLGLRKNIFIQVSDENPDLSQSGGSIASLSASANLSALEASISSFEVNESGWAPLPSSEPSTGLVVGSSSLLVTPGDTSSEDEADSLA